LEEAAQAMAQAMTTRLKSAAGQVKVFRGHLVADDEGVHSTFDLAVTVNLPPDVAEP